MSGIATQTREMVRYRISNKPTLQDSSNTKNLSRIQGYLTKRQYRLGAVIPIVELK